MRAWIIFIISCGLLFLGFKYFQTIKFDTVVSVSVGKGPFKGLSLKLLHYKVSYNDLHTKDNFWESKIGKALFYQLSLTLQTIVLASKKYVDVEFDIDYLGLIRRHYKVVHCNGEFDLISV